MFGNVQSGDTCENIATINLNVHRWVLTGREKRPQNWNLKVKKNNKIIQVKLVVKIQVKILVKIQVKLQVNIQSMCDCVHVKTCEKLNLRVLTGREKRFWQQSFC